MNKKIILYLVLSFTIFTFNIYGESIYSTLSSGHWSYDAINKLARYGSIPRFSQGIVEEGSVITRYEMALYFAQLITRENTEEPINIIKKYYADDIPIINKFINEFGLYLEGFGIDVPKLKKEIKNRKFRQKWPVTPKQVKKEKADIVNEPVVSAEISNPKPIVIQDTPGDKELIKIIPPRKQEKPIRYARPTDDVNWKRYNTYWDMKLMLNYGFVKDSYEPYFESDNSLYERELQRKTYFNFKVNEITKNQPTPLKADGYLKVEDKNDEKLVDEWYFHFNKSWIDFKTSNKLILNTTEFTFKNLKILGAQIVQTVKPLRLKLTGIIGIEPKDSGNYHQRKEKIYYVGADDKITKKANAGIHYLYINNFDQFDRNSVLTGTGSYRYSNNIRFNGEVATSNSRILTGVNTTNTLDKNNNAYKLVGTYNKDKINWINKYYRSEKNFITLGNLEYNTLGDLTTLREKNRYESLFNYMITKRFMSVTSFKKEEEKNDQLTKNTEEFSNTFIWKLPKKLNLTLYYFTQDQYGHDIPGLQANKINNSTKVFMFNVDKKIRKRNRHKYSYIYSGYDDNNGNNSMQTISRIYKYEWQHILSRRTRTKTKLGRTLTAIDTNGMNIAKTEALFNIKYKINHRHSNEFEMRYWDVNDTNDQEVRLSSYKKNAYKYIHNYIIDPKSSLHASLVSFTKNDDVDNTNTSYIGNVIGLEYDAKF